MCRLYGFCATEPTKVECTLVHAQNALLSQSESDKSGKSHSEGWGIATFSDGKPKLERQAWAAYHGEHFQRAASNLYAKIVVAHIRRATVGTPSILNTHPFMVGHWVFAHNGTIPFFDDIQLKLLELTSPEHKKEIKGETDSEHVFAYIRTLLDEPDINSVSETLRQASKNIENLVLNQDSKAKPGLNFLLTNGQKMWGTRFGRSLYYVERPGIYDCQICGFPHVHHSPEQIYWAAVVASEPITSEAWQELPDRSVWSIDSRLKALAITPI